MRLSLLVVPFVLFALIASADSVTGCTSLLVTKGASADGSTMITYTCDGEFHPHLECFPAADHEPGDSIEISDWHGNVYGKIPQVPHTYAVVNMINEHQLAISETTFEGREELVNPKGMLSYWDLIDLALQRARTAREAIKVMTDLVAEFGYRSSGESFSIADPKEVWIMEMIGPGEGGSGAEWVALRLPDGHICAHANKARIGEFPSADFKNCLHSDNVISFAVEKGYYNPSSNRPFLFNETYCPSTPRNLKYCETRVWSIFRRAAPSQQFLSDYHRGVEGAERYPLWIRPDEKLSVDDVFALMRDHYDGTDYDMTIGVDAGPYGCPNRWRPLDWTVDSVEYAWERPISTQQTGFSFVSQSRAWLPDAIGGLLWYGVDDTYTTCYFPLYCSVTEVPKPYTVGRLDHFSWESAWWVFNFVSNFACLKYSFMIEDIRAVQQELEGNFLKMQPVVENAALELSEIDQDLMVRYLTDYSISHGETVARRWRELGERLVTKYNDGYVKDENGRPRHKGYPESWFEAVVKSRPQQFVLPERNEATPRSKLVD